MTQPIEPLGRDPIKRYFFSNPDGRELPPQEKGAGHAFLYIEAVEKGRNSVTIDGHEITIDKDSEHVKLILEILKTSDKTKLKELNDELSKTDLPDDVKKQMSSCLGIKIALNELYKKQVTAKENAGRALAGVPSGKSTLSFLTKYVNTTINGPLVAPLAHRVEEAKKDEKRSSFESPHSPINMSEETANVIQALVEEDKNIVSAFNMLKELENLFNGSASIVLNTDSALLKLYRYMNGSDEVPKPVLEMTLNSEREAFSLKDVPALISVASAIRELNTIEYTSASEGNNNCFPTYYETSDPDILKDNRGFGISGDGFRLVYDKNENNYKIFSDTRRGGLILVEGCVPVGRDIEEYLRGVVETNRLRLGAKNVQHFLTNLREAVRTTCDIS